MTNEFTRLRAPFPAEKISWRVGPTNRDKTKGMALAYIDARDVQDRLDEVFGPERWQNRYPHANGKTVCEIGIKWGDEWIWKADGAGDTDMEAEKGALSDAFKRAAVKWGVGRYLYDMESPWVEIEPAGKSFAIVKSELPRLHKLLGGEAPQKPAEGATAALELNYPDAGNAARIPSIGRWLDLYEAAIHEFGPKSMWAENASTLASIQAKALEAGKQDIVDRVKKFYSAAHKEGKAA